MIDIENMIHRAGLALEDQRRALDEVGALQRDEAEALLVKIRDALAPFIVDLVETPAAPINLSLVTPSAKGLSLAFRIENGVDVALFAVHRLGRDPDTGNPATVVDFAEVYFRQSTVSANLIDQSMVARYWNPRTIVDSIFARLTKGVTGAATRLIQMNELVDRLRLTRRIIWDRPVNDSNPQPKGL